MANPPSHTPVLVREVGELLAVREGETMVDATVGFAGHARMLAERLGPTGTLIGLDVDPTCLSAAAGNLDGLPCRVELVNENYAALSDVLGSLGVRRVDVLFADLGVNSAQLQESTRGMSFLVDGPLDMRMDPRLRTTAADLVNRLKERELGDILYHNAQEFAARKIARRICEIRREGRITTTRRLASIVASAVHVDPASRRSRIHPATRTFQALRIAVNDEVRCLESFLSAAPDVLRVGGRVGVIAFHSGEDRPVKLDFRRRKRDGVYSVVTKKPVVASPQERRSNPRSRSAKFRVALRLSGGGTGLD